jgi:3-mercaptopyruvate sulfurtransferase SseA
LWVAPEQLEARLASGDVLLFDSRPLADFRLGHVALARPLPLDDLAPAAEDLDDDALRRLAAALGAAGFDPGAEMVVTGGSGSGGLRRAAAGCWLLTLAGATRCSVLAGGIEAIRASGAAPVAGLSAAGAGPAAPRIPARPPGLATLPYLREATARPEGAVVDVRPLHRDGDAGGTAAVPNGWIPGALSWPLPDPEPTDRRARTAAPFDRAALERSAAAAGLFAERDLVVVGESFHDGALGWFLLRYGLGVRDAKLFPGGIAAWRRDPSLPFATAAPEATARATPTAP